MLYQEAIFADLNDMGLDSWRAPLESILNQRMAPGAHGHLEKWRKIVERLPEADSGCIRPHPLAIDIAGPHLADMKPDDLQVLLMGLVPWRKGPFRIQNIDIDTEWRSNLKWDRIRNSVAPLAGRSILDVGCGNGYYAYRMRAAGAEKVIGIDPTLLFVCQFAALRKISGLNGVCVLPLRLHELPASPAGFDTTFSMGVLYHQRDPQAHLQQLRSTLREGGELVLETLILPGSRHKVLQPKDRYARMRNVWHLPTITALIQWLEDAGFQHIRVIDVTRTTRDEQRRTQWMPFESLAESLQPDDPEKTIEGLPAPTRAVIICSR
ncbi:MAG: tRNA 5-methoxyuridine(34)/uridine 5-oxyacetic acid(34) synthase CmoB [Woeseiaceae bacterium]